ncbi:hypothetical protein H257_15506 [Aphanomyces astaci]|uniref:Chromo domain-containing protein n=1 Tax=Aphanomyces astaci TaxID=112090 RepID=W4FLV7_APHAT|nr:hypothetical protein H257_15506 [Aphanomyces astaci]ETV68507.1 hypothetical protein H257_15506 [Aphanomyces astaci]|eukprot:XP_009841936.1 hypothetical protein H257_15506 [Aphanomyces astaci]
MKIMGVKHFMTTAGRAQSDGATERQNRTLEDALCCQVSNLGHDWSEHLGTIEYAQALIQASTGLIPFEVDTGRKLLKMALENLDKAQARQKGYYDKKCSKLEFREEVPWPNGSVYQPTHTRKATPMLLDASGHEVFIVEELLKQRQFNSTSEYLVKWHGLPEYKATWELERDIKHVSHFKRLVKDLRAKIQAAKSITA